MPDPGAGIGTEQFQKWEKETGIPYLSARAEYADRYGATVRAAAKWRQVSILMTILCLVFGVMMIWLASQNKVVPYIVQVDKHGYTVTIKPAKGTSNVDQRVIIAQLARTVTDFRTVVSDNSAQKKLVESVYANVAKGSNAENTISAKYQDENPYLMAMEKKQTRQVTIKSIVPYESSSRSGTSWQILWTEETMSNGMVVAASQWRAIIQIAITPVRELEAVIRNPIGVYFTEISMARDIA